MSAIRGNLLFLTALPLLAWLPAPCAAGPGAAAGTTGAQFLELPAGAREIAMGAAGGAISGDATAIYYNPAGLAGIETAGLALTQAFYFQNISYQFAGFAGKWGYDTVFGASLQHLSPGSIYEVDNTGRTTGKFISPRDLAVTAGLGKRFDALDIGLAGKYISSAVDKPAATVALDVGLRLRLSGRVSLSASQTNIGSGLEYRYRTEKLPGLTRVGAAVDLNGTVAAVDLLAPKGADLAFAAGAEYPAYRGGDLRFLLRAGYNGRAAAGGLGGLTGFSAGTGFESGRFCFDYAFMPFGELGNSHWVSLRFSFRDPERPPIKKSEAFFKPGSEVLVNADKARLHRQSDKTSRVLAELRLGEEVEVDQQRGEWVKVTTMSGKSGWLHRSVLRKPR